MSFSFDAYTDQLPAELADNEAWSNARNEILASLRRDAEGLPMTTSQNLIMERMATFYALTRKREADPEYKVTANDMRQNNQQWLAMTAEFNKQLTVGEDKRRETMLNKILNIIDNTVRMIPDDRIREDTRKRLSAAFLEADL